MRSRIAKFIASFGYVGFVPIIPGTFGSLAAFAPYALLMYTKQWQIYLLGIVVVTGVGIWAAGRVEKDGRIIDPSYVVIDEVAGQLITLFLIPVTWLNLLLGFLIFRALDIIKPFPAKQAEDLHGGFGIMMDDVLAGIYGNILLHGFVYLWNKLI